MQATEAKINWDYITPKSYAARNEQEMRRQSTEWVKTFANHVSDEGLISKIYKKLMQLNSKETNKLIFKIGKEPE